MSELRDIVKDRIVGRARAYKQTLGVPGALKVLADLAKFCRAHETTTTPDQRLSDVLAGRREVWLHIQKHLQLSDEEIWNLRKDL